jgi:uncharacterized protein
MLISFSVENYLSFKDKVTFSFNAASIKEHPNHVINTSDGRYNLLNGVLIYGANGSGKSNLIKAISFVKYFVVNSFKEKQSNEPIGIEEFMLSTETVNKPSTFEIEILINNTKYRYGFVLSKKRVLKEWLYLSHKIKEHLLFERSYDNDFEKSNYEISSRFKDTDPVNTDLVRENALFLSVSSQFNGVISMEIIKWLQNATFVSGTNYNEFIDETAELLLEQNSNSRNIIIELLKSAKLGFSDVKIKKRELTEDMLGGLPKELRTLLIANKKEVTNIKTVHTKRDHLGRKVDDIEFDLMSQESLGSQKFFALIGPIYQSLLNGSLLMVDELDARLHSNLSRLIIDFYQNEKNNPNKSQFIFTTHNTQFLDRNLFRRDQLYMIDKSENESSFLYNILNMSKILSDAPTVRNDASFEKDYLEGKYGAVPFDKTEGQKLHIWKLLDNN